MKNNVESAMMPNVQDNAFLISNLGFFLPDALLTPFILHLLGY